MDGTGQKLLYYLWYMALATHLATASLSFKVDQPTSPIDGRVRFEGVKVLLLALSIMGF